MIGKLWDRTKESTMQLSRHLKTVRADMTTSGKVSSEEFQVYVKMPSYKLVPLLVEPFDTIAAIKDKIEVMERIPRRRQSLYFSGMMLDDRETLYRYNIRSESTVLLKLWDDVPVDIMSSKKVQIFVKLPCGKSVSLQVDHIFDTIAAIKVKIEGKEYIPCARQRLYFSGALLDDRESLASCRIPEASTLKLKLWAGPLNDTLAEVHEEKKRLQRELRELKSEFPEQLSLVLYEKDQLQKVLNDIQSEFPRQLALVLDEKYKLQQHLNELQSEFALMSVVHDQNAKLKEDSTGLQSQLDTLKIELGQERERRLCTICFDKPRDTLVFSCLHLHFCSSCLAKHQKRTNTCPTCRSFISGKLVCNLSMDL